MSSSLQDFQAILNNKGLMPPEIIADGRLHRCSLQWQIKELEDVELDELKRLLSEGYSIRDCAEEMGKSKGAIQRLKKKLEGE